jgi:hypothetical protein
MGSPIHGISQRDTGIDDRELDAKVEVPHAMSEWATVPGLEPRADGRVHNRTERSRRTRLTKDAIVSPSGRERGDGNVTTGNRQPGRRPRAVTAGRDSW